MTVIAAPLCCHLDLPHNQRPHCFFPLPCHRQQAMSEPVILHGHQYHRRNGLQDTYRDYPNKNPSQKHLPIHIPLSIPSHRITIEMQPYTVTPSSPAVAVAPVDIAIIDRRRESMQAGRQAQVFLCPKPVPRISPHFSLCTDRRLSSRWRGMHGMHALTGGG